MTRSIGPIEPKKDITLESTKKAVLPTPNEFQLPEKLKIKNVHTAKTEFPSFAMLDHAKRLQSNPAQATFEVLNQEALPEGKKAEKTMQNQAALFLAQSLANFKGKV